MKTLKPIFIWAGGKSKMLKHHVPLLPNDIKEYSEPFFGGGAMFSYIKNTYNIKKSYINDVNEGIINIYRNIKNDVKNFCKIVDGYEKKYMPLTKKDRKKMFYDVRHSYAYDFESWDKVYEASTLYFLMKTGFNGIWQINKNTNNRYGTPSGLLNQKHHIYDKELIFSWSKMLENVEILCGDYKECPISDFNYMDPPYRNSFTKYGTSWNDQTTEDLLNFVKGIKKNVMLCNRCDGTDFFESRKGHLKLYKFPVTYTAGRRKRTKSGFEAKKAVEILLTNIGYSNPFFT